jgi:hypothetical protein
MSVSILSIASGAATPVSVVNLSIRSRLFALGASGAPAGLILRHGARRNGGETAG